MPKRTTSDRPELKPVNVGAAAIDIGSKMHMAAVNPARTDTPVRTFGTFTQDLHHLADWFKACGVTSAAARNRAGQAPWPQLRSSARSTLRDQPPAACSRP